MDELTTIRELAELAGARVRAALVDSNHGAIRETQERVLRLIDEGHPTVTEIARRTGNTPQAASKVITELRVAGYVTKSIDEDDPRRRRITITPLGYGALKVCDSASAALWDQIRDEGFRDMRIFVDPMPIRAA